MYASVAADGGAIPAATVQAFYDTFLIYEEPDLYKCLDTPYFCDDKEWDYMTWRRLCVKADGSGDPYPCSWKQQFAIYSQFAEEKCYQDYPDNPNYFANGKCTSASERAVRTPAGPPWDPSITP